MGPTTHDPLHPEVVDTPALSPASYVSKLSSAEQDPLILR